VLPHDRRPDEIALDGPAEDLVLEIEGTDLLVVAVDYVKRHICSPGLKARDSTHSHGGPGLQARPTFISCPSSASRPAALVPVSWPRPAGRSRSRRARRARRPARRA